MRLLITGFTGFVSQHFLALLDKEEPGSVVMGVDKHLPGFDLNAYSHLTISFEQTDLLDRAATDKVLDSFQPGYILHLASVSSVAQSWQAPRESFVNNTSIFLNLVEWLRINQSKCRFLSIGSSEEFGDVTEHELPLTEEHTLNPQSPYAVARVAQEMMSSLYANGFALDIMMTRSFNHIGPGQRDSFVISSFAKQLVKLANNNPATSSAKKALTAGDLSVTRDFTDVRDVARAYYLLLKKGRRGEVYNICSGKGILLKDIITKMSGLLGITVETILNPELVRPNENKIMIGSFEKIKAELGWQPEIEIEKSLLDIIGFWRSTAT